MKCKHRQGCDCCGECSATVYLTVVDNCTDRPIPTANATATTPGAANVVAPTDANGKAVLVLPAAGTWKITAVKANYVTGSTSVTVACGDEPAVTLGLWPPTTIVGCTCQVIPSALQLAPNDPTLNGGMFQPCTLAYGPVPPEYAKLALGAQCFLSTATFTDSINQVYRYFFTCTTSNFTLTRVYASSIFGSPYRDSVRYTWPLTAAGNTCSPFLLSSGQVYQGGDARSQVTVSPASGVTIPTQDPILVVTATDFCSNAVVPGAAVTAVNGTNSVSGTTNSSGVFSATLPHVLGDWNLTVTLTGYATYKQVVTVANYCTTYNVAAPLHPNNLLSNLTVHVNKCAGGTTASGSLAGSAVTLTQTGQPNQNVMTNAAGDAVFSNIPSGTWNVSASAARFLAGTTQAALPCNSSRSATVTMPAQTPNYVCGACLDPTFKTAYVTDPVDGRLVTLTFTSNATWCGCDLKTVGNGTYAFYYQLTSFNQATGNWRLTVGVGNSATCAAGCGVLTSAASAVAACQTGIPMTTAVGINFAGTGGTLAAYYGTSTRTFPVSE